MPLYYTEGLVVREIPYGEADKILHVLTASSGKISVYARGVRSFRHRDRAAAQLMSYNEFVLHQKKDFYYLKEASVLDNFHGISEEIERLALAQYCMEVACDVCVEGEEEEGMLRLLLNMLHAIRQKEKPLSQIKAVFELRTTLENGWMPSLLTCADCASPLIEGYFDLPGGVVYCPKCHQRFLSLAPVADPLGFEGSRVFHSGIVKFLPAQILQIMRYILTADPKRILAFSVAPSQLEQLQEVSEAYLLHQLERSFPTLDFYRSLQTTAVSPS